MSTAAVVIVAAVAVLLLLALAGAVAQRRRLHAGKDEFRARVRQANADLATAHAQDRGWDPARLEAAARRAFADSHPGAEIEAIDLVAVVDRPGTDEDEAFFRVNGEEIQLTRRGDDWLLRGQSPQ